MVWPTLGSRTANEQNRIDIYVSAVQWTGRMQCVFVLSVHVCVRLLARADGLAADCE